jgi:hypothetical protein
VLAAHKKSRASEAPEFARLWGKEVVLRSPQNHMGRAMKKVWQWVEVGFALCAIGVLTVFLVYASKVHSEGAAAWIQAVGSIAAIGVAIWVSNQQHHKELARAKEAERREALRSLTILGALIESIYSVAESTADALEDPNIGDTRENRLTVFRSIEQLRKSFYELPLQSMPDVNSARLLVDARWYADSCFNLAEHRSKIRVDSGGGPGKGWDWRCNQDRISILLTRLNEAKADFR